MIWTKITIQDSPPYSCQCTIDSHIVLTLSLIEKQRTVFPRKKLVAHISGGFPLPSTDRYDLSNEAKLKIIAIS